MQFVSQRRISLEDREASRLEVRLDGERREHPRPSRDVCSRVSPSAFRCSPRTTATAKRESERRGSRGRLSRASVTVSVGASGNARQFVPLVHYSPGRYADQKRLPSEVISLHPQEDPAGVAMGVDEDHASIWIAEVRTKPGPASQAHAAQPALAVDLTANTKTNVNAKTTETKAIMRVRIPQTYPFQGPIVSFKGPPQDHTRVQTCVYFWGIRASLAKAKGKKEEGTNALPASSRDADSPGREVRFVMGAAAMQHDACPSILHATWTPAQSILDAVVATADLVRRAEIEDHLDFTSSPRPQA